MLQNEPVGLSYRVKVRGRTFLYGGDDVQALHKPPGTLNMVLFFRVSDVGETIKFGVRRVGQPLTDLGSLGAGECFVIHLDGVAGVYAVVAAPEDSDVDCTLTPIG